MDIDLWNSIFKSKDSKLEKLVLIIDEYSDLSMQDLNLKKNKYNIENKVIRLCQKARAAGIHVILATQRPDAKTLSGLIRANCPTRIGLKVANRMESNIILGEGGCEKLNTKGDMIIYYNNKKVRCQGYA